MPLFVSCDISVALWGPTAIYNGRGAASGGPVEHVLVNDLYPHLPYTMYGRCLGAGRWGVAGRGETLGEDAGNVFPISGPEIECVAICSLVLLVLQ